MKKLFSILLVLLLACTLVGCSGSNEEDGEQEETAASPKIGVILVGDENEAYTYAHMKGIREAAAKLGIADDAIIWKYNIIFFLFGN